MILYHNHSNRSVFDGMPHPHEIVERAKELGHVAVGLTDHGTTTGLYAFYKACKKQGLNPLMGVEFYLCPTVNIQDRDTLYHLVLLAKNYNGYKNILKLTTIANQNFYYKPRIDMNILAQYKDDIICTSACLGGPLNTENADEYFEQLSSMFGEDFYVALHTNTMPEQREYNLRMLKYPAKFTVETDAHYLVKEDAAVHRKWKNISDDSEYYTTDDYYLLSDQEVIKSLSYLPAGIVEAAMANTDEIGSKCNVEIPLGQHYPVFQVDDPMEEVKRICREGWKEKIIGHVPREKHHEYAERVKHEFDILEKASYQNYFCIIHDLIAFCREEDIPVGDGRGSVGGSLVAYLMGITNLDPMQWGLVFERFCHLERVTPADIDTDVSWLRRGEVIEYVKKKYGSDLVFQVRTFNNMGEKGALHRAGQALDRPPAEINVMSKKMSSLDDIEDEELRELAKKFNGMLQNFGVHASAVVVFPEDPCSWCAIEKSGDNFVAAYDFHELEEMGLLKLDILGLATLDVIDGTMKLAEADIDLQHLPVDEAVMKDLAKGNTCGCFQIESPGMTRLATSLNVSEIEHFSALVALFRPGPLDSGITEEYVKRRRGESPITYPHPLLEPILKHTYGMMIYQEQIMQIAQALCGYTLGEADVLRRIIGRKQVELMEPAVAEFVKRGVANGHSVELIQGIADQIISFASYCFNQAHSAAYGYTSYKTAYLKHHYPREFMCSLLNSVIGDKDETPKYVEEARKMGIKIYAPSLCCGKMEWQLWEDGLMVGFQAIKGVGGNLAAKLPTLMLTRSLTSNFHECNFDLISKTVIKGLIKAGCFEGDRNLMLAQLDWYKDKRKRKPDLSTVTAEGNMTDAELEHAALGFSLSDPLEDYQLFEGIGVVGGQVLNLKPWTTKQGKPMVFINVLTRKGATDLIQFDSSGDHLEIGKVYLFGCSKNNIVNSYMEAKRKGA